MSDFNSVKAQIQSLIDSANATTGNTDTNLTDGVNALIGGYGQGGSSGGAELNIHYGDTEPTDTSMLWCKCEKPSKVLVKENVVIGDETITTLAETISSRSGMTSARVGKKIYLFGGYNGTDRTNTIQAFDTETNTNTILSTKLPKNLGMSSACAIGTIIYIFGGQVDNSTFSSTIYKFDTETETISTLSTSLPLALRGLSSCAIDNEVYIFGGESKGGVYREIIYKFDTETETISTLSTGLPIFMRSISSVRIGQKIYLFGGRAESGYVDTINVFDIETKTITTLSVVLSFGCITYASVIGSDIYLFGGENSDGRKNTIMKFDTETETISTLSTVLPTNISSISVETTGTNIYIFGGYTGAYSNNIYKFALNLELEYLKMLLHSSTTKNVFNILNGDFTIETGVKAVYLGNSDGQGELVDSYLYQNETWTPI